VRQLHPRRLDVQRSLGSALANLGNPHVGDVDRIDREAQPGEVGGLPADAASEVERATPRLFREEGTVLDEPRTRLRAPDLRLAVLDVPALAVGWLGDQDASRVGVRSGASTTNLPQRLRNTLSTRASRQASSPTPERSLRPSRSPPCREHVR
jgi:hypothetical protein